MVSAMLAVVMKSTWLRSYGDLEVVVAELAVLLWVEDLEQGRGRVSRKSAPTLSISSSMKTGLRVPAWRMPWMMRPGRAPM